MTRVIGIDFGTSTTYMNVKRYNGDHPLEDQATYLPVMFNFGESSGCVATIVRENADGSFDFGETAAEELDGSTVHTGVKMRLESPDETERTEARRITRAFFKFLYETYAQQAGSLGSPDDQEETLVSYPVKWQKETASFMLDAARDAGFQNVRGMDEAEAAVTTVLCQNSGSKELVYTSKPGYLLLIDMGAGTTDLVVCRYQVDESGKLSMELVTSWPHSTGEPTFGGREIDDILEGYVEAHLTNALRPEMAPMAHTIAAAPGQAKQWKERNVSMTLRGNKPVTTCAYIASYKPFLTQPFSTFGRKEFEELIHQGLQEYARLLEGCLEETAALDSHFAAVGVDLVLLTGGHSAWYFAREMVDGTMKGLDHPALAPVRQNKHRVLAMPNPQTTVSLGLVYSKLPMKLGRKKETKPPEKAEKKPPMIEKGKPSVKESKLPATAGTGFAIRIDRHLHKDDLGLKYIGLLTSGTVSAGDSAIILKPDGTSAKTTITRIFNTYNTAIGKSIMISEETDDIPIGSWLVSESKVLTKNNSSLNVVVREDRFSDPDSHRYKWDPRLLPTLENFIRTDPYFAQTNEQTSITSKSLDAMCHALSVPGSERIYYAIRWEKSRHTQDKEGRILSSKGIYTRWMSHKTLSVRLGLHMPDGFESQRMTWQDFLNCDAGSSYVGGRAIAYNHWTPTDSSSGTFIRLQYLLRDKAFALENGQPI